MERSSLTGRDYIETMDWTTEEIDEAIAVARELKDRFKKGEPHRLLPDKTIYLLFLDKSTRTRNAFETGITQLGGHGIFLDADKTHVAHGESPKDMGIILSRYGHGIGHPPRPRAVRGQHLDARGREVGGDPGDQPAV